MLGRSAISFKFDKLNKSFFGKFTIIVSLVLMLLANFVPARLGSVLSLLCWALLIYTYFRMFSRQTYKRACENQAYLAKTAKFLRLTEKYNGTEKDTSHLQMSDL